MIRLCCKIGWGYSRLSLSLLSRSVFDLRASLATRNSRLEIAEGKGFEPMCFALGWPLGLSLLLEAGADLSVIVHQAIRQEDKKALRLLLQNGCPLFAEPELDW